MDRATKEQWAGRIRRELTLDILPFWMRHTVDRERGGFHGEVDTELRVNQRAERAAVLNARILWTFAAACRSLGDEYRETADWAYDYIVRHFWDPSHGGIYWMLDCDGRAVNDRKQTYAQAFAVYALAEYFMATGRQESLEYAQRLYRTIEEQCYDRQGQGYVEARSRNWGALEDQRLSEKDLNCPKSMNTHLHVLEAYTNLLRAWRDPQLVAAQERLVGVTMDRIVNSATGHFRLFFENDWTPLNDHVSYGHDIEGSWLLVEAAEVVGEPALLERARALGLRMAESVYREALDQDGSIFYEADGQGRLIDPKKHWWAQAEAVVGFYNAFELSGDEKFRTAAYRAWCYIEERVVDKVHGEWHAKLRPDGTVLGSEEDSDACLAGPWKCPYHNSRVCYEMLRRLERVT